MLKKNKILQYASRFVYYFDGELKRFVKQNSNGWELERAENSSKSPQVIIVARHLYQETLKKLPVENLKQARSILKLEIIGSKLEFETASLIGSVSFANFEYDATLNKILFSNFSHLITCSLINLALILLPLTSLICPKEDPKPNQDQLY